MLYLFIDMCYLDITSSKPLQSHPVFQKFSASDTEHSNPIALFSKLGSKHDLRRVKL